MANEKQNGYICAAYITRLVGCHFPDELAVVFQTDKYPTGVLVREGSDCASILSKRSRIVHPMVTQVQQLARIEFSSARSLDEITKQCAEHMGGFPYIKDSPYRPVPENPEAEIEKFGVVVVPYSRICEHDRIVSNIEWVVSHILENELKKIGEINASTQFEVKVQYNIFLDE